ncbi:MAG: hypothetical protein AMXMBFR56_59630 [Polyangiaceae bacterium]
MFPVKRAAASSATLLGLALTLGTAGACGYQPVHGGQAPADRLSVVAAPALVPDAEAQQAALAGARSELGREGVLGSPTGYPRLVVELVRVDAEAVGIAELDGRPIGRGAKVSVVARGWVEDAAGAPPSRVTGDVRRALTSPEGDGAISAAALRRDAARRAGEAAGRAVARHVLGIPTARE